MLKAQERVEMPDSVQKIHFEPVNAIREVFSYIKRFKDRVFVIRLEDSLRESPLFPILIKDIVELHSVGIKIVIVPGTRDTINKHLSQYSIETEMVNGIRITTAEVLPMVKLAAMDVIQDIISHLAANGARGLMGNWVKARSMGVVDGVDYQFTGDVEKVSSGLIESLLGDGFIPIISSIGWNSTGASYNVNSNVVLHHLCKDMDVAKVFHIIDKEGIEIEGLELDENIEVRQTGVISNLDIDQAKQLLQVNAHTIPHHTRDMLEHSIEICSMGVNRVHFVSGLRQGSILLEAFSSLGGGTMIYANKYCSMRNADVEDVPDLLKLMEYYVRKGILVERTEESITLSIKDFYVYEVDGRIHGCGALHHMEDNSAEIAAIAVDKTYKSLGIGRDIVEFLIQEAQKAGIKKLFILTTQTVDWFYEFGFVMSDVKALPRTRMERYNENRNSKVLIKEL